MGAVLAGELLAFYLVCAHQVRRAQLRQHLLQIEAMALHDCLAYMSGATIARCAGHRVARR